MKIQIIKRKDLDVERWNEAICSSANSRVYALSPLLDAMWDSNWQALVVNDYEYIMPLTSNKKKLIDIIYQPLFLQQLGIFYQQADNETLTRMFEYIKSKYWYGNIFMNADLTPYLQQIAEIKKVNWKPRVNYILDLSQNYDVLHQNFSTNCKRILKKNISTKIEKTDLDAYHHFYLSNHLHRRSNISKHAFDRLISGIRNNQQLFNYQVLATYHDNEMIAAAIYILFKNRIIYISGGSNEKGSENKSMFSIKNHVIQQYSNTEKILDFEGSNIPSVARFFENFGAVKEVYMQMAINRLPYPVNIFFK